jgi:signal transduction histidine kinase
VARPGSDGDDVSRAPWSLRRRLGGLIAITAVLLLALVGFASVILVQVHRDQDDVTNRYFTILSDSNSLYLGLIDAETAVRGYIITGDQKTLEPLRALQSPEYQAQGAELRRLIAPKADLREALATTSRSATDWYTSFVAPSIARVQTQGPRSVTVADVNRGKAQFDQIRQQYNAYRDAILAKRTAANRSLTSKTTLLFVAVVLAALGALAVGIVLFLALRRWVTRPLEGLAHEIRLVRSGELSHQIEAKGPPEIAGLGQDVDMMRERLVEQLAQVETVRDGLEVAQERLQSQAEELKRSNRDLEQFAYVASHDLQEPLRKVASFCQLLERRYAGQLDDRADQYIAYAVDGAKRMQQLINDLLAFSRIGRSTTGRSEVPLDACLAGALRNLDTAIEESDASIISHSLPAVWGEKALLTALLQNLLSNAIKFRGEQAVSVRLTVEAQDDEYLFRCSDNGIGIEPQYAERIFVIFQRLHGKDQYFGTGIGLAMCKKIVEWHGGRIWLDTTASAEGTGTTFAWTLPVVAKGRALMNPEKATDAMSETPELASALGAGAASDGDRVVRSGTA